MAAHETNSVANGALAEAIHGVRAVQSMDRQGVNSTLYDDKAKANLQTHHRALRAGDGADRGSTDGVAMALVITEAAPACSIRRSMSACSWRSSLYPALLRPDPFADTAILGHAARYGIRPALYPH